jgi:4-amino-4-deoxychorismate lyase
MCLLLETIRVVDGRPQHLGYHQHRVDRSRQALFGAADLLDLSTLEIPAVPPAGVWKWRIIYGKKICNTDIEPYEPRTINCVKLVYNDNIDYPFKYSDRAIFAEMLALKGNCDDILVVKNGLVTDLSYANIAFYNGEEWSTPRLPLLAGTCRKRLLERGMISEADIRPGDLGGFKVASAINAMLGLGDVTFPVSGIIP